MRVFNGSTGAVRGNQGTATSNFSCRNTTTYSDYYISSVSLTVSGGTIDGSTTNRSVVYFGSTDSYIRPHDWRGGAERRIHIQRANVQRHAYQRGPDYAGNPRWRTDRQSVAVGRRPARPHGPRRGIRRVEEERGKIISIIRKNTSVFEQMFLPLRKFFR